MFLKKAYRLLVPKRLRESVYFLRRDISLHRTKKDIIKFYASQENITSEQEEVIKYLKNNKLSIFPYEYAKKYNALQWEVYRDSEESLPYVYHENKKLFFKKSMSLLDVKYYYNSLLIEQDINSPHCYLTENFNVDNGSVLADIGAAEGILTLSKIDQLNKAYLFEPQEEWVEALKATFEPWKEKVTIVRKFVGNKRDEDFIIIDDYFADKKINFFKIDVEGFELDIINGARNVFINKNDIKIAICTYHKKEDAFTISQELKKLSFEIETSKGYMIFLYQWPLEAPYLRKAVLRCIK